MSANTNGAHSVRGGRLAFNSGLNLATGLLVLLLNLLFVPLLIHAFGTELFGVLAVTWMVLANLAWLDLGFSRAAARFVAQELAAGQPDRAAAWTWTAVLTQTFIGCVGAAMLFLLAPKMVHWLHVAPERQALVTVALQLFAFAVPLDLAARSMTGVLQAGQRFGWVNAITLSTTLGTFGIYGVGILRGADFAFVIYGLFSLRFFTLAATCVGAATVLPTLRSLPDLAWIIANYRAHASTMIRFGSWVSATAFLGMLLLYFDQWLIGFVLGIAVLPYYVVPLTLLNRLAIFPSSLTATLFPAFSALQAQSDWPRIENYFLRSNRYILMVLIPILFVLFVWGFEIFRLWIGAEFAAEVALPLRILICGFAISLLAPISGSLLEASGRPDLLTKLYLVELPFNFLIVLLLTRQFGIVGAAISYTIRAMIETGALWTILYRVVPFSGANLLKRALFPMLPPLLAVGAAAWLLDEGRIASVPAILGTLAVLAAYGLFAALFLLDTQDRHMLRALRRPGRGD
ncbi:MAG TPA: oligosaccharide flippase family protein [Allosphingosinicella sp.]|nr:oligosaccharide flippase family protein [Allosphingosinicella sp.]